MAWSIEITRYIVGIGGKPIANDATPAWIRIVDAANRTYMLSFHHTETELPLDGVVGQMHVVNMPLAVLPTVLDVLRNERPIRLVLGPNGRYFLTTDPEEVGASE